MTFSPSSSVQPVWVAIRCSVLSGAGLSDVGGVCGTALLWFVVQVASKRSGRVLKKPMKFISPPETPKRKRKTSALANSNKVAHALTLPGAVADGVKSKGRGKGNWGKGRGRGRGGRHATPNIGGVKSGKRVPGVAYRKHGTSVSTVQPGGMDDPELMMDNFLGDIRDIGVYDFGAASAHDAHDDQGGRSVIDGIVDSGMMSHAMSHSMPGVGGGINEQASVMDTISQMGVPVHGALEVFPGIESFEGLDSSAIPTSTSSIATASDAEDDLPLGPAYPSTTELPGMNWVNAIDTFAVDMSDEDDDVPLNIMHKGGRF